MTFAQHLTYEYDCATVYWIREELRLMNADTFFGTKAHAGDPETALDIGAAIYWASVRVSRGSN